MMTILVKGDDVRNGTKADMLVTAHYGQHESQWVKGEHVNSISPN